MIADKRQIEEVKVLVVGTEWASENGKYKTVHHWLEIEVPLFGSVATFDSEEKAKDIYEGIPIELEQFKIEYIWQSEFHWQSETIKEFLDEYGQPSKWRRTGTWSIK